MSKERTDRHYMLKRTVIIFMMCVSLMAAGNNVTEGDYPRSSNRSSFSRMVYTISCFAMLFASAEAKPYYSPSILWPLDHGKLDPDIHGHLCSKENIQKNIYDSFQWTCSVVASFPLNDEYNTPRCEISGACKTKDGRDYIINGSIVPLSLYGNQRKIIQSCEDFAGECSVSYNTLFFQPAKEKKGK